MNVTFAKTLIDQLVKQGVTYFCLSPGFRSTPIAIALAEDPRVETFVHFDERGAAFHALGRAKATKKPVGMVVTSGTAVGNLMPAVMEASMAKIPLILLTCDRPHDLRDTGANQMTDQVKIFGNFVRYQFDFPIPNGQLPPRFLATAIAQGVLLAQYPMAGPVQFNLPFSEPFFNEQPESAFEIEKVQLEIPDEPSGPELHFENKKGVIIVGAGGSSEEVSALSTRLNWPVFADIASNHRERQDPNVISYYHHILKSLPDIEADVVIHIGGGCVSKVLLQWISKQKEVIHVAKDVQRFDPHHIVTKRVFSCNSIQGSATKGWLAMWKDLENRINLQWDSLSEPALLQFLEGPTFFANSMPIRDADMFFFPKEACGPIFANRGLSGIDGNIATICGIASCMPVSAIVGDQTLLHDLNSLAQLRKTKYPVQLFVINNGGGGIFSFVAIKERKDLLDTYFAASHDQNFEKIAEGFGLTYERIDSLKKSSAQVVEVVTNRSENVTLHEKIDSEIKEALCSFSMAF